MYAEKLFLIKTYIGTVAISFAIAAVVSLAVEMPFINLDQLFFNKKSFPASKTTENLEENVNLKNKKV